jgi:hypothetical protein
MRTSDPVEEFGSNTSNHSMPVPVPPMMDYYSRPEQQQPQPQPQPRHNDKESAARAESALQASSSSSAHLSEHTDHEKTTTTTTTTTVLQERLAQQATERAEIEALARRETRQLRAWRLILVLVMLATGAMVATGTYLYIRNQQADDRLASVRICAYIYVHICVYSYCGICKKWELWIVLTVTRVFVFTVSSLYPSRPDGIGIRI